MRRFSFRFSPIVVAVVLSAAVHLAAIFGHRIDLLPKDTDLMRMEATMKRPPPAKTPGDPAPQKEAPQPPVPQSVPEKVPQPAESTPQDTPPIPQPEPAPETEPPRQVTEPPQPEIPAAPPEPPKSVGSQWPRKGAIKYLLYGGEGRDPNQTSTAELRWEVGSGDRYTMSLESKDAKPFPSMPWFTIALSYKSEGLLNETGFQPERYEEAVSVFQHVVVNLDWTTKQADLAGHKIPLRDGTVDFLSVMMQAGYPGFLEHGNVYVATARGIRQYQFSRVGSGNMTMPFGMTWPVVEVAGQGGKNDVRVWLATDKFNLPVQIKFVINRVNYYLVANEILVSKDALINLQALPAKPIPEIPHAVDQTPR